MEFEILHNGENIKDLIEITECYSFDRYGGMLDDLAISFVSQTNKVSFDKNDELTIRTLGGFTTGTMYLDSCVGRDGRFTVKALSCRHTNKRRKSKIWHQVKLSKISKDVAANTGLTLLLYGVDDFTYVSVSQINEPDLQMLSRVCKREGYSIKCDNGNLIIFNEYYLEHISTPIEISKGSISSGYSFHRSVDGLASMTVRYFNPDTKTSIAYTAGDSDIPGGEDSRIEFLTDIYEAQRFSYGYLREANKYHLTGILGMSYNGSISAGTVCDLTGFEEFDGRYVVYEVKHDFMNEKTVIKVRKLLDY